MSTSSEQVGDVSGLSRPVARWAMVWAWLMNVVLSATAGSMMRQPWVFCLSSALVLLALLLLTSRTRGRPSLLLTIAGVVSALVGAALELVIADPAQVPWLFLFAVIPVALVVPRGHPIVGGLGLAAYAAIAFFWTVATDQAADWFMQTASSSAVIAVFAYLWWMATILIVRRERLAVTESAERLARRTAARDARVRASAGVSHIATLVSPVLGDIAAGTEIDDEAVRRLTVIEGEVRDHLRAATLRDATLSSAVATARWRGVRVVLLGEQDAELPEISPAAAFALGKMLADAELQSITIRQLPPGRAASLSVVAEGRGGTTRLMLDAEGEQI